MQKTLIYINAETKAQIDSTGYAIRQSSAFPSVERGQWQILCFQFLDVETDEVGGIDLKPHIFTSNPTFVLVADNDFKDENDLMFKSCSSTVPFDQTDITSNRMNIEGDWIDGGTADISKGQLSFRVNADTSKFTTCVGSNYSVVAYISVKQYEQNLSNPSSIAFIRFTALNTIRDWSAPEEAPSEGTALIPFVDAYLKQPIEFQFSVDGTKWHAVQTDSDIYYRMRISGMNTAWSTAIALKYHKTVSVVEISALENGMLRIDSDGNPPVLIETSKGTIFTVRDNGYLTVEDGTFFIDPTPYLVEDNTAEFTGTWKVWLASGSNSSGGSSAPSVTQEEFNEFKTETYTTFTAINETLEYLEDETFGMLIKPVATAEIPFVHATVIKHTLSADEVITVDTSGMTADKSVTMELWLSMPETVVSFSMPDVTWIEEPSFDTANMLYCVVLRWDGEKVLANVAYTLEVG